MTDRIVTDPYPGALGRALAAVLPWTRPMPELEQEREPGLDQEREREPELGA